MAARRARCFRASSREEIKSDRRAIAAPLRPAKPANEFGAIGGDLAANTPQPALGTFARPRRKTNSLHLKKPQSFDRGLARSPSNDGGVWRADRYVFVCF